jgi:hypothetical protein
MRGFRFPFRIGRHGVTGALHDLDVHLSFFYLGKLMHDRPRVDIHIRVTGVAQHCTAFAYIASGSTFSFS